ncbi:hypothetical protein VPNG_02101 [Cytospora leucostoma]|uniref:Uncharacterized protein n=1 Tax=Cytospora leucostoma TaxID=1230097 RepID=A0A423XH61_9PEZI|nr:hypothetical protein VPNG_02101 [Cytospora leucostoma]
MPLRLPAAALPKATIRPARGSLHHPLSPLHMTTTTTTTTTTRARPILSFSFSTSHPSSSKDATILMDQTRRDNRPGGKFKQGEGEDKAQEQEQEQGQGGRAGEGELGGGGAVQKDVEGVEGAKQHSVKRPVPTEGNTAAGRGGDAL